MAVGTFAAIANGCTQPFSYIILGELVTSFIQHAIDPDTVNVEDKMKNFSIFYMLLGLFMILFGFLQNCCWQLTATRQKHRIRVVFFESIIRQEISWFDVNESGGLTTRLAGRVFLNFFFLALVLAFINPILLE